MNKTIIAVIGVVVVGGGVYAYSTNQRGNLPAEQKLVERQEMLMEKETREESEMMENNDMMKEGGETSILNNDDGIMTGEQNAMAEAGLYEAYSEDKIAKAETGDVVIFFHASWCPSCRGLNSDIEENLSTIPAGVTILKADYDKETELKKKYGVTTQHTLVQVDKDGNIIKKWSGGSKLDNLLSQIQ